MKTSLLLLLCLAACFSSFGQLRSYTPASYVRCGKSCFYYQYTVNGQAYQTQTFTPVDQPPDRAFDYLVAYDPGHPERGVVCFDRPVFRYGSVTAIATGSVILRRPHFFVFQFAPDPKQLHPVTVRQTLSDSTPGADNIRPYARFEVEYDSSDHDLAVLYPDLPWPDSAVGFRTPYLTVPNGIDLNIELRQNHQDVSATNAFLKQYGQGGISSAYTTLNINTDVYFKNGFWSGLGIGWNLGRHQPPLNFNVVAGYLQQLDPRYYLSLSLAFSEQGTRMGAFADSLVQNTSNPSRFQYRSWNITPKLELMRRKIANNVWGTQFLKLGIGASLPVINGNWKYQTGEDKVNSKNQHYTKYTTVLSDPEIPRLSQISFFISLSYSFLGFFEQ